MEHEAVARSDDGRELRIAQLEHALVSRVVIEQAKGIIFERFGLTMRESFELLRQAARSHQIKLRGLAEQLVETRETPPAILAALVGIGHPYPEGFTARAAATEQLFADLNQSLLMAHRDAGWREFICECANPLCAEAITLSAATLEKVHSYPGHYVLKAGHQIDAVEKVVDRIDGLVIVEKPADPADEPR